MSKSWRAYALHILDAIGRIERIRQRGDLTTDEVLYDAALRNLQTLSEATRQLPEQMKMKYPDIPWREISGFRNILVHNYLGEIDPITVASVAENHLEALRSATKQMLNENNNAISADSSGTE
ncbi:MAG: DUF86 domain-containing protein [Wenzhouxiangella sp.]|nr:MAG: DUF86 domain-containing protein [Wenzhouxiangella sp.]